MKGRLFIFLLSLAVLLFPACQGETPQPTANGTLRVVIENPAMGGVDPDSRGVEPQGMEVAKYRISATGPENAVLGPIELTGSTSYETSVIPGTWNVNVAALNSSGLEIGGGSNTVEVHAGSIAQCSVKIVEKAGKGQVNFNIEDTTGQIASMTASIYEDVSSSTPIQTITLEKVEESNKFIGDISLDNGTYRIVITSGDNEIAHDDSVRIYAGITTQYNATYTGKSLEVTIVNEIIVTPTVEINLSSGAEIASNGTIVAVPHISGIADPVLTWTLDAKKIESTATDDTLIYELDGTALAGSKLRLTLFVSNASVIWSESVELTVNSSVTMPSQDSVTISVTPDASASFNEQLTFSITGDFPEGTGFAWNVAGADIEGNTYTANEIGSDIPVAVTASKNGVQEVYSSKITVSPTVSASIEDTDLPQNAYLAITGISIGAPHDAEFTFLVNGNSWDLLDGDRLLLAGIGAGESIPITWSIAYNDDAWTGDIGTISIVAATTSEAPTKLVEIEEAGETAETKITFIDSLVDSIIEPERLYEIQGGDMVNLDQSFVRKANVEITYKGYTSNEYTFWGTVNEAGFELTVQNSSEQAFKIGRQGETYYFNDVKLIIESISEAPQVNTADNPDFGGSTSQKKFEFINTVLMESMPDIPDSTAPGVETSQIDSLTIYDMTGYQGEKGYTIWGRIQMASDMMNNEIDLIIRDVEGNVFSIYWKITPSYKEVRLNGVDCSDGADPYDLGTDSLVFLDWMHGQYEGDIVYGEYSGPVTLDISSSDFILNVPGIGSMSFFELYGNCDIVSQRGSIDEGWWEASLENPLNGFTIEYEINQIENGIHVYYSTSGGETQNIDFTISTGEYPDTPLIPDYTELSAPVEPVVHSPESMTDYVDDDLMKVFSAVSENIIQIPMMGIIYNNNCTDLEVGPFVISIDGDAMSFEASYPEEEGDTRIDFPIYDEYGTLSQATLLSGSSLSSPSFENVDGKIKYLLDGTTYTAYIRQTASSQISDITFEGIAESSVTEEMRSTAEDVFGMFSMYVTMSIIESPELGAQKTLGKDIFVNFGDACFNASSFSISGASSDVIISMLDYQMTSNETGKTYSVSSPGLRYCATYDSMSILGPVIVDGEKYYFDIEYSMTTESISGGIWSDGTWKKVGG